MKISLKARNLPRLLFVWLLNVAVFSGLLDIQEFATTQTLLADLASDPGAGLPYAGLLTLVAVFNGAFPRPLKEHLVFWPAPRPGSRAFSHFMFKDSTIDRTSLQHRFDPLPTLPDEQNALWAGWLNQFEDDARVRPTYGLYLFARDWTVVAVVTLILAAPLALWFADDTTRALWYGAALLVQIAFARWLARVQGSQLVMSVMSCKASSLSR